MVNRVSTSSFYDEASTQMLRLQASVADTQGRISSSKRIQTPSDDPNGAARLVQLQQYASVNQQYTQNRAAAKDALNTNETVLNQVTAILQQVHTLSISANNAILDDSQRTFIANELQSNLDQLMGLANTKDASGNYIFSGFQVGVQAFTQSATGVQYHGDQGQKVLQVSSGRQMALNVSGDELFMQHATGNGDFVTQAGAGNTGTGVISPGSLVNSNAYNNHQYTVSFSVAAGVTTYQVVDNTNGNATVLSGQPYVNGQQISFNNIQFAITGNPANGDQFTIKPSVSQDVFKTIGDLIATLKQPVSNPGNRAQQANGINTAQSNLNNALNNVLATYANVGSNLSELDSLDEAGSSFDLQYQAVRSQLEDLDLASAISKLSKEQLVLQAAQKSFVQIANSSLFDLIR